MKQHPAARRPARNPRLAEDTWCCRYFRTGAHISEAARVHDALRADERREIRLALIDLGLPDGSGVDVVAALREVAARGAVGGRHDPRRRRSSLPGAAGRRVRLPAEGAGARAVIVEQLKRMSQGEPPLSPSIARRVISRTSPPRPVAAAFSPHSHAARAADRPRKRSAAARGQGLHAAGDRRAAEPVAPHHRLAKTPPQVLVDCNGVGYEVDVPMSTFYNLPGVGEKVTLLTHFVVREDAQILFGFLQPASATPSAS
jgi:hypothetical protein